MGAMYFFVRRIFTDRIVLVKALSIFFVLVFAAHVYAELEKRGVSFGSHTVVLEVAETPDARMRGLMFRRFLEKDHGMLFVFEDEDMRSFWMKDTPLNLDIAFISRDRIIIDIQSMEALSERAIESNGSAQYVIEMNRGWFAEHGVTVGDAVMWE